MPPSSSFFGWVYFWMKPFCSWIFFFFFPSIKVIFYSEWHYILKCTCSRQTHNHDCTKHQKNQTVNKSLKVSSDELSLLFSFSFVLLPPCLWSIHPGCLLLHCQRNGVTRRLEVFKQFAAGWECLSTRQTFLRLFHLHTKNKVILFQCRELRP